MKAIAEGIFRGKKELEPYSFKNNKGEDINVNAKIEFKFDEVDAEGNVLERTFKINAEQSNLSDKLEQLELYQ